MSEQVGIRLTGGPAPFDGWTNIYEMEWPPPMIIEAYEIVDGVVAIAVEHAPALMPAHLGRQRYHKVRQSKLPDDHDMSYVVRGAEYEAVEA